MSPVVVGFASPAGGGKDMAAEIVREELEDRGVKIQVVRFADPLKAAVSTIFGWPLDKLNNDIEFKETVDPLWDLSPRQALQEVGTDLFREWRPKIWINAFSRHVTLLGKAGVELVLCPDARFNDEFETIQDQGLLVFCNPEPRIPCPSLGLIHSSERSCWLYEGYDWFLDYGHSMSTSQEQTIDLADHIYNAYLSGEARDAA